MKKKIFIAINIPEDIKSRLLKYTESGEFVYLPVFWTSRENLHITLKFLGYADDDEVYETAELLKEIAEGIEPFDILIDKILPEPEVGQLKMVWAVGPVSEDLQRLHEKVSKFLSDIPPSFAEATKGKYENPERKFNFKLHITLGRVAKSALEKGEKVEIGKKDINISFPVHGIELMESFKEGGKTKYAVLQSAEFREP